ncbi:MAG: carbon-nitrogen hydrolase family protein [Anaerolineales bacterium]
MPKTIHVATTQMDATPAPLTERLERAETLVSEAARVGAQLVVLPELFNIGYAYTDQNFEHVEAIDGKTSAWMKATAARFNIHLAGTILLFEDYDVYNSMLLFSPHGQMWRYDKNYPWAWEHGYFRERKGITVAKTELGDLGMLICWDVAHPKLWKQYAGKTDMIVAASCPPDAPQGSYDFPGGEKVTFGELGNSMESLKNAGKVFFGDMVDQQAKWLGVPVVNSGASGTVKTPIPKGDALLKMLALLAPHVRKLQPQASQMQLTCEMMPSCKVANASGCVVAERMPVEGEGYVMAEVSLGDTKPMPRGQQPKPPMKPLEYQLSVLNADVMVPAMMKSVYKNGLKKLRK